MDMYRKFRGADPDKTAMLKARGLYQEPEVADSTEVVSAEAQKPAVQVAPSLKDRRPLPQAGRPQRPEIEKKPIK
jgi:hypothetical protein